MKPWKEKLHLAVLELKHGYDNDNIFDVLQEVLEDGQESQIKNVCTKMHISQVELIEQMCSKYSFTKAQFVRMACMNLINDLEELYQEYDVESYLHRE